jgi:hypothetical protein
MYSFPGIRPMRSAMATAIALAALAVPFTLAAPAPLGAQGPQTTARATSFSVELFRPFFRAEAGESIGWNTGGAILAASTSVGSRSRVAIELPLAWGSWESSQPEFSSDGSFRAMGNPRISAIYPLGAEDRTGLTALEPAVRLPLARSSGGEFDALLVGAVGDPTHLYRWPEDVATVSLGLSHQAPLSEGAEFRVMAAPALWFSTGGGSSSEAFVEYEAGVRTLGPGVRGGVELRGIAALGSDYGGFSDRTIHRIQAELGAPVGRWRVTGFARATLDEMVAEIARFTVGARVEVGRGARR